MSLKTIPTPAVESIQFNPFTVWGDFSASVIFLLFFLRLTLLGCLRECTDRMEWRVIDCVNTFLKIIQILAEGLDPKMDGC